VISFVPSRRLPERCYLPTIHGDQPSLVLPPCLPIFINDKNVVAANNKVQAFIEKVGLPLQFSRVNPKIVPFQKSDVTTAAGREC
jgi:hypothetical protein